MARRTISRTSGSYLSLVDVGSVAIAHRARLDATFTLQVALMVKLFANALCPLTVELQWFGRVTQVSAVQ